MESKDGLVGLCLKAAERGDRAQREREWLALPPCDQLLKDFCWLYRRPSSENEKLELTTGIPNLKGLVKPLVFEAVPKYQHWWTASGEGVALYLDAEPWAFVDETTHLAYSKGVTRSSIGNGWDQELFEKLFGST